MEEKTFSQRLQDLYDKLLVYIQLRVDYFTLFLGEYVVFLMARLILAVVLFMTFVFAVLFLAGALVAWIGMSTGNWPVAMLAGAGVFMFIGVLTFLLRKPLIMNPLNRLYVRLLEIRNKEEKDA
jgi:hypothetical protein